MSRRNRIHRQIIQQSRVQFRDCLLNDNAIHHFKSKGGKLALTAKATLDQPDCPLLSISRFHAHEYMPYTSPSIHFRIDMKDHQVIPLLYTDSYFGNWNEFGKTRKWKTKEALLCIRTLLDEFDVEEYQPINPADTNIWKRRKVGVYLAKMPFGKWIVSEKAVAKLSATDVRYIMLDFEAMSVQYPSEWNVAYAYTSQQNPTEIICFRHISQTQKTDCLNILTQEQFIRHRNGQLSLLQF
jgi:hypothetical protein